MAVFDSTIQKLFEFRASEIMKTDGIRKQAIGNYFYGFVQWDISNLHTRVSEHLGISALTGKTSSSPQLTSIFSHLSHSGHTASLDNFKILSSFFSPDELLVRKSLFISKLEPTLNQQGSSSPLSLL